MNKVSRTRNYIYGIGTGYFTTLVTVFVGLWLTPFTLRHLDREEYAIFTLASDVLMWLVLLDLGLSAGLNVQAAQLSGKPDQENINRLVSSTFFAQLLLSAAIITIGAGLIWAFPVFFPIRPDLHNETRIVIALLVIGSSISLASRVFSALLIAHQQIHIDNLIKLLLVAIRTLLIVVLLFSGYRLISLAIASLVATIITSGLAMLRTYRLLPGLHISKKHFNWEDLRTTGGLGIWFSLGALAGIVISSLDRVVTGRLISVEIVTTLALTGRVYILIGGLLHQISNTARPMLGQLFGQNKLENALKVYRQIFSLSTGLTIVAAAAIFSGNMLFVQNWVGDQNYGGLSLDIALALNMITHAWVLPNRAILSSNKIVKPQTISRLIEGVLNLSLAIILAKYFGIVGIVISTTIAGLLTSNWYLPWLSAKMFKRPFIDFLYKDLAKLLGLLVLLAPISYLTRIFVNPLGGYIGAMLGFIVTGTIGVLGLWFYSIDKETKNRAKKYIMNNTPFARLHL